MKKTVAKVIEKTNTQRTERSTFMGKQGRLIRDTLAVERGFAESIARCRFASSAIL